MGETNKEESAKSSFESAASLRHPGGSLDYTATAAWLRLRSGTDERERAEIFYSYYRDPSAGSDRPLTFVFNGGPGAASAYLHVGALGPRRVVTNADGTVPRAPAQLTNNDESWLAFSDLVFIDPVGTGLSRTLPDEGKKGEDSKKNKEPDTHYWNVESDLESLCEFFERFLSEHKRWHSPIFIAGESYGGYRVARLTRMMQEKVGIGLSGTFVISPALEWESLLSGRFDPLKAVILVPSMAAAAHAHGLTSKGRALSELLPEVERFAMTELLPAIATAALDCKEIARDIAEKMSSYIGLSADLCQKHAGRIDMELFSRELLRSQRKTVGLYDASVSSDDPLPNSTAFEGLDPTLEGQYRLFASAANAHLRDGLGVDDPRRYYLINFDVNEKWRFASKEAYGIALPRGATEDLAIGMASNPQMRAVITHGYFDLVTPYFMSNYLVGLLHSDSPVASRITLRHFSGGHMFYTRERSRREFTEMAKTMVAEALG